MEIEKQLVHDFWNQASCGESLYLSSLEKDGYEAHAEERYKLEPYIEGFAQFESSQGKRLLEIGVGLGADHQRFAQAGADLYGIDLTERAVDHTQTRFAVLGLRSKLSVGDAENLTFSDETFDFVYSWGVLHHSPDTQKAVNEVWRTLKAGGIARVMIYHKWSLVGFMLWFRYALLGLRPWMSMRQIYARYLESPGTKAYSVPEAQRLFKKFRDINIQTVLTHGDLLESGVGQRHKGLLLSLARRMWPRSLFKRFFPHFGLFMLITARK